MKTTKQLARELGIIKKRSLALKGEKKISRQTFSYLIIIDFESTCWQDGKFRTQEIIEFPAVLLNTSTGKIENEFQFYIQPQEQPILSEFCKQLTGITQEQVDNGIPLYICIRKFLRWLEMLKESKSISFPPSETGNLATVVTWSDWDLGVCLFNELRRKQIPRPPQLNSWIDLRATYKKFYSRRPNGLNGALKDLGIDFEGREHSGLHDSRNTAILAYRMIQDGCIMTITKSLKGAKIDGIQKILPVKPATSVTPTKSPACKRRKVNDDLDLDDSLDHAISSSQDLDNLLTSCFTDTPERKRKTRECKSHGADVISAKPGPQARPVGVKMTKIKTKRTNTFNHADIHVYKDPKDNTSMFTSGIHGDQKLTEVSVNVPLPAKKTPSKHSLRVKENPASPTKQSFIYPSRQHNESTSRRHTESSCRHNSSPRQPNFASPSRQHNSSPMQANISSPSIHASTGQPNIASPSRHNIASPSIHNIASPSRHNTAYSSRIHIASPSRRQIGHSFLKGSPLKGVLISVERNKETCNLHDVKSSIQRNVSSPGRTGRNSDPQKGVKTHFKVPSPPTGSHFSNAGEITPQRCIAKPVPSGDNKFVTPNSSTGCSSLHTPNGRTAIISPGGISAGTSCGTPSILSCNNTPCSRSFQTPLTNCSSAYPSGSRSLQTPGSRSLQTSGSRSLQTPGSRTFQTPSFSNSSTNPSGMKGTPPLCKCGKRSKRRTAQTPGPNLGRTFFTCGSSTYNHSTGVRTGCGFFKWETPCGNSGRTQSFTQNGTVSKPFIPVFNSSVNSTQKKNLGVRSNKLSNFR